VKIIFIVPSFNAEKNLENIYESLVCQTDDRWSCVMIDDMSTDKTWKKMEEISNRNDKFSCIKNKEKKFALRNIVEISRNYQAEKDTIIAVIDGDDQLCNENTVKLLADAYQEETDTVWTAHKWDINGMNISKSIPENVDPYQWPWCSSHLRTFRASLLKSVPDTNFKDTKGFWFKRGYDQALMLPLLKVSRDSRYIDRVCYLYNIESVSVNDRDWAEKGQHSTINIVRSRGFLNI
jgi:glycosyltransferase involved in cell wall biosynthesis